MGRLPRRRGRVRSAVLQHLAARGPTDRSAGAPVPAVRLSHAGGCGPYARIARHGSRRRVRRRDVRGISAARRADAAWRRRWRRLERQPVLDREPRVVLLRFSRAEHGRRHDVLLVADGDSPGAREPVARRVRRGVGRRRERVDSSEQVSEPEPGSFRLQRRPLPQLRRGRRRLRARRGRGRGAAQADRRRAGRRRRDPCPDPRLEHQSRRQDQRLHGAQPGRPARADRGGAGRRRRACRRDQLCRGARHRHRARRSDRDRRVDAGFRRRACRSRTSLRDRLGEIEHRPCRKRGGHCRADQGAAADAARPAGSEPACRHAESAYRFRAHRLARAARAGRLGAPARDGGGHRARAAADRRHLVVRCGRGQRAPDRRGVRGEHARRGRGRRASRHARDDRAVGTDSGGLARSDRAPARCAGAARLARCGTAGAGLHAAGGTRGARASLRLSRRVDRRTRRKARGRARRRR
ncbi:hypothetical protein BUGL105410_37560 [Burkholderia gladioli]